MSYLSDQAYHQRQTSRRSDTLADPPQDPVVVKVGLRVQPGTFCTHQGLAEGATKYGSLMALNRLPRASHRQWLT